MNDFSYAKFIIYKGYYSHVRKALGSKSSSSVSENGLERFLFDDGSSVHMPAVRKPRVNILTVKYQGRRYPAYIYSMSKHLGKMHSFRLG